MIVLPGLLYLTIRMTNQLRKNLTPMTISQTTRVPNSDAVVLAVVLLDVVDLDLLDLAVVLAVDLLNGMDELVITLR